jgi:hypothetical protein
MTEPAAGQDSAGQDRTDQDDRADQGKTRGQGKTGDQGKTAARTRSRSAGSDGEAPRQRARPRSLDARQAARRAAGHVLELTGHEPENVVSIAKNEDGWHVGIEVVELRRIPDSADIMAVYELVLDSRGDLVSYRREQRYHRGSTERD